MPLTLRNPHSVLATFQARPKDVLEVVIPPGVERSSDATDSRDAWARVAKLAKQHQIPVKSSSRGAQPAPRSEGGRTGAAEAVVRERSGVPIERLFEGARGKAEGKGLWIALDSLQDPHNLGAIFRTSAFFGVQGIVLTQERSAPLSGAAYDVASGGMEFVPFTLQTNLQRAFEAAKEAGLWILGTSEHANDSLKSVQRDRPWLLVLGNEEKGMRRLTEESCDVLCKIPCGGEVTSLNVSVAAGIFISALTSG